MTADIITGALVGVTLALVGWHFWPPKASTTFRSRSEPRSHCRITDAPPSEPVRYWMRREP
jgi:hypothetical protein